MENIHNILYFTALYLLLHKAFAAPNPLDELVIYIDEGGKVNHSDYSHDDVQVGENEKDWNKIIQDKIDWDEVVRDRINKIDWAKIYQDKVKELNWDDIKQSNQPGHPHATCKHASWAYSGEKGPEFWEKTNIGGPFCSGKKQSPIDLSPSLALKNLNSNVNFKGYERISIKNTEIGNNGHSVQMTILDPTRLDAIMSGGPLPGSYFFKQLHFHWGSEHTVKGHRYPLEMHMVHLRVDETRPLDVPSGLAVAGFFFEISENDNLVLNPLLQTFGGITEMCDKTNFFESLSVPDLIAPAAKKGYYSYFGSLTTPTCNEVVEWIVFKTPLQISNSQMSAFLTLRDGENKQLKDNYRPVQQINGRKVKQTHY